MGIRKLRQVLIAGLAVVLAFGLIASPAAAQPPEMVKVLIGFDRQPGSNEEGIVRGAGGAIKHTYHLVPAIAASIPEAAIQGLLRNPRVTIIEPDITVYAIDAELDNSWGVKHIGAGTVHDGGNKGTGVKIAVIDSGIDYNHPDLDDNYVGGYDFVNKDDDPMDDDGHGTHVAGTVAAEDNEAGVVGVAPGAKLYAYKVLEGGSGFYSDIIAALEQAVEDGIQVTNNSYGSPGDPGELVKAAFDNTYAAGMLHVAAAGNEGNPPGRGDNVIYPARWDSVIAVAATDESNNRARWSSTGLDVELSAPGVNINSTLPGGGYGWGSGTSMASPHVAGTAALVISAGITGNNAVRQQLVDTADDLGDTGWDTKYGYGLVDADEAAPQPTDTTPPAKVIGLTVTPVSYTQLDLTWDANTEADLSHYNVYRSTTSSGPYDLIASPTTSSYSDTGLTVSTIYYYVVSAVDTSGNEGEKSAEASGTTGADDLGPVTSNVVADPNPTNGASSIKLSADIDDSATGNSNITGAEWFTDEDPGVGDGTAMFASDGAFNEITEAVTADIDVSGWTLGDYTLYVRGLDAEGNWGPTDSVVLHVTAETPTEGIMHVANIEMSPGTKIAGRNTFYWAIATVTVIDADGNPVEGVTVYGQWSGLTSDSDSGITDANGQVTLQSDNVRNAPSGTTFTFTVDNVVLTGWTYDPEANVETSDSIIVP